MANLEKIAEDYTIEAEIKSALYDDKLRHVQALLVFSGIICQMESDVLLYRSKHGSTEKIKPAMKRIENLKEVYEHINGVFEQNERYKLLFRENHARAYKAENQLEEERTKSMNIEEWTKD